MMHYASFLPEIILATSAMIFAVLFSFSQAPSLEKISQSSSKIGTPTGGGHNNFAIPLTAFVLFVVFFIAIGALGKTPLAFEMFVTSDFTQFSKAILIFAGALIIIASLDSKETFEFYILFLLIMTGAFLMVSSKNMLSLFLSIELVALPSYILASFCSFSKKSTEAGVKYFVLGAVASALFLYGVSLIYGVTGSTSYDAISRSLAIISNHGRGYSILASPEIAGAILGMVFIIAGLAFKCSAAPFHMWTPDVYNGSPTFSVLVFASIGKFAAVIALAIVTVQVFTPLIDSARVLIQILSALSMIIGAFGALVQTNLKRLLAYSSIGHVGYALMSVAILDAGALSAALYYMLIYAIMSVGTFLIIITIKIDGSTVRDISSLKGLAEKHRAVALAILLLMFSMAGIPPFAGFFAKYYVFAAAIQTGDIWLAIVGAISSVIAAFYYIRLVKYIWFDAGEDEEGNSIDWTISHKASYIVMVCAALVTFFVFFGNLLSDMVYRLSYALLAGL